MGKKKSKKTVQKTSFLLPIFLASILLFLNQNTQQLAAGMNGSQKNFPQDTPSALLRSSSLLLTWGFQKFLVFKTFSDQNITKTAEPKVSSDSAKASEKEAPDYTPQHSGNRLRVPILMYHYIGLNPNPSDKARDSLSISPEKFERQMKYLKENGYTTTSLDTLYAALKKTATLPEKVVILTFDDGYIDFYFNAYPILKKYGFSATIFIPTGLVGQPAYLSWSQIKDMHSSGLVVFGAHTVSHPHLPSLSRETALKEITESKNTLSDHLGVPVNFLAYPYGSTNESVITLTKEAGYTGSVGTWPDKIQSEGTIYNMPRLRVSGGISLDNFAGLL
ncbi:hypothetical protein A3A14_00190 [Candidatus Daviesbacteria bacterium RIFCSPLOWO2_01_FULL_43_38]|uniref:NodB homology domain-containing protein n=2 Tax=Candidatus Daviesiibacteriota TaxID=1752718 RepID=A0A1F5K4M3_9BACT|nr:MAG: hypothetical protein A2874_00830 [Candidatus Daviesbacteria bacterium RIFCSPHIGHO2_01_FULL_43_17]OGE35765.1 MAG: hypothetical protein A3E45_00515 [Candidatus Daviesbacteria bacterium RIFCSPHIGHO2_12_FULL_43_11]OGE63450.1 MAG: hypothetical protein A3A14_00190 [Candidatus Daviesbacteria bacterium RIFCSPLOWO2_01_FULL_43_38]OGE69677.1 MAG: hypothetical protein A3J21_03220 [Candidatus Daviesbacteria bacterium RIFCSPLOWO2_02_FULL_43_11]